MWNLSTNRYMRTVHEDVRGSIILIPQIQLSNPVYGRSVDAQFKEGEPRELYILMSSASEITRFLDQKDFKFGLKIRTDRSIVPTCGTYTKLTRWPECDNEDNELLLKVIRAQLLYKQEFVRFRPEFLEKISTNFHPRGFRSYIRVRAHQTNRPSVWRFKAVKKSFELWLKNLGPDVTSRLLVSRPILRDFYHNPNQILTKLFKALPSMTNQAELLATDTRKSWDNFETS